MLREPQHERNVLNHFKAPPFVLSPSKDSEGVFQQPASLKFLVHTADDLNCFNGLNDLNYFLIRASN